MITQKLYLYDSSATDYKGTDYSQYILSGFNYTDDLTEVLDTCEITLVGLSRSEEFAPTTKFILELYEYFPEQDVSNLYDTYSLMVADDVVEQPILSDDTYFNHSITFNEASVVAQGRIVDDMSETFELKKVNINSESSFNPNKVADYKENDVAETTTTSYITETNYVLAQKIECRYKRRYRWVFSEEYMSSGDTGYGQEASWTTLKRYQPVSGAETVTLPIPLMATYFGVKDSSSYQTNMNLCSVVAKVYSKNQGETEWTLEQTINTNPSTTNATEYGWQSSWRFQNIYGANKKGYDLSYTKATNGVFGEYYKKYAEYDNSITNRSLTISLVANKNYKVIVEPRIFTDTENLGTGYDVQKIYYTKQFRQDNGTNLYTNTYSHLFGRVDLATGTSYTINNSSSVIGLSTPISTGIPALSIEFSTYIAGSNMSVFLESAPAISAYDLFVDAQLKSQATKKVVGTYIKDTPLAYYCEESDINTLRNTEIIESSFHQKNFWEILLEIGKYIHAIPYIEFGENDRFVVKWRYLGQTDQLTNYATRISIFNSRSVENYVGAVNSYVNNMIQRGGEIEEYVAPKTESEDYLVYNDTAVIKTAKPIIEITGLKVRCIRDSDNNYYSASTTEYNIIDYVYEHNVYELLDVVATTIPNKGLGIYYNLGENVIRGLNYQLPSENTGDAETEYAIKRIIGTALGITPITNWVNIKINDFIFHITYRTKENVRSEQSRPDLRKYLMNSAYETMPHHKQFNNQQDKMVDSVKFGNQTYGKLIKTGNTEYQTTEWNNSPFNLKIAGQLESIRGNLYYVSKATHTFFQDHIDSEITYSKDYNQLSEIIGIPSEPRFFEISEQSNIDRNISFPYLYAIKTSHNLDIAYPTEGLDYLKTLLFNNGTSYPLYACTQIKNDALNPSPTLGIPTFFKEFMHPISTYSSRNTLTFKWEMVDNFSAGDSVVDTIYKVDNSKPINTAYSKLIPNQYCDKNGRADLVDFVIYKSFPSYLRTMDNIKALPKCPYRFIMSEITGSLIGTAKYYKTRTSDNDYTEITLNTASFECPIGSNVLGTWGGVYDSSYNNITGNESSYDGYYLYFTDGTYYNIYYYDESEFTFYLAYQTSDITEISTLLQKTPIQVGVISSGMLDDSAFGTNNHGYALIKDNRERIIFNCNIQMLTDSDRFVLSGYMWQQNKTNLKLAILNTEVNKIIGNTIPKSYIENTYALNISNVSRGYSINISTILNGVDLSNTKAIAIISEDGPDIGTGTEVYFVMARNVSDLDTTDKSANWYFSAVNDTFFEKQ